MSGDPVLLYDGGCGFCGDSVQLVLRHDRKGTLRFASLQGDIGSAAMARHPELNGVDSMVWLEAGNGGEGERALVRSDAALEVARYMGGLWRLALLLLAMPRAMRDRAYDLVARHRHRLARSGAACIVPAPHQRHRFLDEIP
jgi:predicted DCC family thiol-disulfide oxidoreductase YuxK